MRIPRSWGNGPVQHRARLEGGSRGERFGEPREIRFAYTEDVQQLVTSSTGQQELSSTLVIVDLDQPVNPGDEIEVWPGTPDARWSTVLTRARYKRSGLPESRELRLR